MRLRLAIVIADQREIHLPVLEPRHGRRQEAAGEEDIRLHRPVRKEIEFVLQFVAEPAG